MQRIDAATGLVVSHTPAPRKRMFEDLETAAKAMREQDERKESIFRQSVDAEKNKADLMEKKFAEALRKAKDAPRRASRCATSTWTKRRIVSLHQIALGDKSDSSASVSGKISPLTRMFSSDTQYSGSGPAQLRSGTQGE